MIHSVYMFSYCNDVKSFWDEMNGYHVRSLGLPSTTVSLLLFNGTILCPIVHISGNLFCISCFFSLQHSRMAYDHS